MDSVSAGDWRNARRLITITSLQNCYESQRSRLGLDSLAPIQLAFQKIRSNVPIISCADMFFSLALDSDYAVRIQKQKKRRSFNCGVSRFKRNFRLV